MTRIALDVDGTLADTMSVWLDNYNRKSKKCLTAADVARWNFWEDLGFDLAGFYRTLSDCWSVRWADVPLIENNVVASIEKLRSIAKVDIVTARDDLTHSFVRQWLAAKQIPYDSYVGVSSGIDKAGLDYDYFIDDSPDNAVEIARAGKNMLLYDQSWNRHVSHTKIKRIKYIGDAIKEIRLT